MLVKNYLYAVVSLPAGVFQPYSGVKTSILLMDKALAKRCDSLLFVKVENDGFDLGAQRRKNDKNDLPETLTALQDFHQSCLTGEEFNADLYSNVLKVEKEKIGENGEWNLSGERYRENAELRVGNYELVVLGEVSDLQGGFAFKGNELSKVHENGQLPVIKIGNLTKSGDVSITSTQFYNYDDSLFKYLIHVGDILIAMTGATVGKVAVSNYDNILLNQRVGLVRAKDGKVLQQYLTVFLISDLFYEFCQRTAGGGAQGNISPKQIQQFKIPLPPLKIQQEIVAEIEGYQKIIDGARSVVDNYKPQIQINPDWPIEELSKVTTKITDGAHFTPTYVEAGVPFLRVTDITKSNTSKKFIPQEEHNELIKRCRPEKGDVLYSKNGTIGIAKLVDWDWEFSIFVSLCLIKPKKEVLKPHYLSCFLNSNMAYAQATARSKSGTVTNLHLVDIKTIKIPVPPIETQKEIVAQIEKEQSLVNANKDLITLFEQKIKDKIASVWGE